jgi:xylan 1,4-beta-xylosidase
MSKRVRGLQATPKDLALLRKIVSESAYPLAEIHLTEWSSSPSSRDHAHDEVPAAIFIARTVLASLNLVDTLAYWTFTDVFEEEGAGLTPFRKLSLLRSCKSITNSETPPRWWIRAC